MESDMRRFTRLAVTLAMLFTLMLPAGAYNPKAYRHPCNAHTNHVTRQAISGTGGLYSEASLVGANRPTYFHVNTIVYYRPSIQHSNWTEAARITLVCNK